MTDSQVIDFWKGNPGLMQEDDFDDRNGYGSTPKTSQAAEKQGITDCQECIGAGINGILCCKSHPETHEQTGEGYCPNFNGESGLCSVYNTDNYPIACLNYHCKTHGR